ncbi:MAG: AraC family transcriptional regulator ligand-binding domain-containing protein [Myxococcota bacterium]
MVDEQISKHILLTLCSFAVNRGLSFDEVVEATGLEAAELVDPTGLAPASSHIKLVLTIQEKLSDSFVPLEIAKTFGLSVFAALLPALRTAPTMSDAFRFLATKASHFGTGFEFRLDSTPTRTAWIMSHPSDAFDHGIGNESGTMSILMMMRSLAKRHLAPAEVCFPYAAKARRSAYRAFFGAPISFEKRCEQTEIVFRRDDLETPLPGADHAYFDAVLRRTAPSKDEKPLPPVERLRRAMLACARDSRFGLEAAASKAGMSVRTAQRIAASSGTSPSKMLDTVRAETLRGILLRDPDLPLSVLAERLDYSDERSLRRAFKRLTGHSPRDYRRQLRLR